MLSMAILSNLSASTSYLADVLCWENAKWKEKINACHKKWLAISNDYKAIQWGLGETQVKLKILPRASSLGMITQPHSSAVNIKLQALLWVACGGHPQWEGGSEAFRDGKRDILDHNQLWEKVEKWESLSHVWLFATPWTIQSGEFSRKNTGVGSLSLPHGIFPTQGSNPGLPHCSKFFTSLATREAH